MERSGRTTGALLLLMFAAVSGCSDDNSCVTNAECFAGEACIDQECAARPSGTESDNNLSQQDGFGSLGGTQGGVSPNLGPGSTNADNAQNDTSANSNSNGGDNNTSSNGSNNSTAAPGDGMCRASAFDPCPQDDGRRESPVGEFGHGCVSDDNNFTGGTIVLSDRAICPGEDDDSYSFIVNRCASTTFLIDMVVTPTSVCPAEDWLMDVTFQAQDCDDPAGMLECHPMQPDGSRRVTLLVPSAGGPGYGTYVDVVPLFDDVRFDYELTATYYQ